MRVPSFVLALSLVGCDAREPQRAEQADQALTLSSATIEKIRKEEPWITERCLAELQRGTASAIPDDKCYKFGSPQRMQGKWAAMFEGSQFCPSTAKSCRLGAADAQAWLSFGERANIDFNKYRGGVYAIDFIGRRTIYPGYYGHMGGWKQEVLVDRLISIRELKSPPED